MQLISAADILISGGQIDTAGGNLLLDSGTSPAAVKPTLAGTDVTVGTLSFGSDLQFAIAGAVADTDYTQLNVVGSVNLTGAYFSNGIEYTFPTTVLAAGGRLVLEDPKGGDMAEWPADLRVREFPKGSAA